MGIPDLGCYIEIVFLFKYFVQLKTQGNDE